MVFSAIIKRGHNYIFLKGFDWPLGALFTLLPVRHIDCLVPSWSLIAYWLLETLQTTRRPPADQNNVGWPVPFRILLVALQVASSDAAKALETGVKSAMGRIPG